MRPWTRRSQPDPDVIARLRLARTEGVGPITWRRLLARFGNAAAALEAVPRLARAGGRAQPPTIPTVEAIGAECAALDRLGARLVFLGDPGYPPLLAELDDAPACLSVLGDPAALAAPAIAIVGGRNASSNGRTIAEALGRDLAAQLVVVSGLARGIDTAAHLGALETGRTVAVVAGGLDRPYPETNAALQERIAASGAVVAEAPLGTTPQARHFPRRNRIIAGLTLGVVVVEAALRSGSLITARRAQEAGREVFAVPGSPLDPRAHGGNGLLRDGAVLVETAEDVLAALPRLAGAAEHRDSGAASSGARSNAALPLLRTAADATLPLLPTAPEAPDSAHETVRALLSADPVAVDDLVRRCQLSPSAVAAVLLDLELAGALEALPGGRVMLLPAAH